MEIFFSRRNFFESLERQEKRVSTICLFIIGLFQRRETVSTHHALFIRRQLCVRVERQSRKLRVLIISFGGNCNFFFFEQLSMQVLWLYQHKMWKALKEMIDNL